MFLINKEKNKFRKDLRGKLNNIKAVDRELADSAIRESLLRLVEIQKAEIIAVYSAVGYEVDLKRFIAEAFAKGKRICLPRSLDKAVGSHHYEMAEISDENDLDMGKFNIPEPGRNCQVCEVQKIDVWLVPGIAFDLSGTRLGRGAGVYDRLLENVAGIKIGVLYQVQIVDFLPRDKHDCRMDMLVTEQDIFNVKPVKISK